MNYKTIALCFLLSALTINHTAYAAWHNYSTKRKLGTITAVAAATGAAFLLWYWLKNPAELPLRHVESLPDMAPAQEESTSSPMHRTASDSMLDIQRTRRRVVPLAAATAVAGIDAATWLWRQTHAAPTTPPSTPAAPELVIVQRSNTTHESAAPSVRHASEEHAHDAQAAASSSAVHETASTQTTPRHRSSSLFGRDSERAQETTFSSMQRSRSADLLEAGFIQEVPFLTAYLTKNPKTNHYRLYVWQSYTPDEITGFYITIDRDRGTISDRIPHAIIRVMDPISEDRLDDYPLTSNYEQKVCRWRANKRHHLLDISPLAFENYIADAEGRTV